MEAWITRICRDPALTPARKAARLRSDADKLIIFVQSNGGDELYAHRVKKQAEQAASKLEMKS